MEIPSRDEQFYFAMTIFEVEGKLFKLPRRPFEEQSDVFQTMFLLPPGSHAPVDGLTDDRPLRLEGVSRDDFKSFLRILFPPSYGEAENLDIGEWLSVLNLSSMWGFTKIRLKAIECLQSVDINLVTKIELAHKYDIREWIYPSYLALGKRPDPLSVDEGARLGWEFAVKMASVREFLLRDKIAHPNAYLRPRYPTRGDSPRAGSSTTTTAVGGASRAGGAQTTTTTFPPRSRPMQYFGAGPFGNDEENEEEVLGRAIEAVFGIKDVVRVDRAYAQHLVDGEEMGLYIPPADFM